MPCFIYLGGEIKIDAIPKDNQIEVIISDNGVGISDEIIESIFKNNEESSNGTFNEKGVGLGLIVCKEFVEKNGGKIWAESTIGKGSVFLFTVPKATSTDS